MFEIHMGFPEMEEFWESLKEKVEQKTATKEEEQHYKQIGKALALISDNPRYPGLNTHDIPPLTQRYGMKVWESYLSNKTPGAGRIFWVYGPERGQITIIGIEPHPDDKSNAYKKITLSKTGEEQ